MKTFFCILVIGLLGFLGCSSSNDGTSTTANVGKAIPVEPFGIEDSMTPTYEWTSVQSATRYHLLVQETIEDSTMQDTNETYLIDEWYTTEEAGCTSEENLCMVAPDIDVDGAYTWKVMACAGDDCGLWSDDLGFSYPPPATPRFTDNGDGTVTDNYTALMWAQDANLYGENDWWDATSYCWDLTLASHSDWSLPYISELNSLIDEKQVNPALPPDNPFAKVQSDFYWSSTADSFQTNYAWGVHLGDGSVGYGDKSYDNGVWCVRGDGRAVPDPYDGGCPDGSCQDNKGPYRVYMFENYDSVVKDIENFGFKLQSYAHSCKDWQKSVSSFGNQLTVNTGTCKTQKNNVTWIKKEVISKGFTPITWEPKYMVIAHKTTYTLDTEEVELGPGTPGSLDFVIYGDFKPRFGGKSYTCPNVMIGMGNTGPGQNTFWFFTNTTNKHCTVGGGGRDNHTYQITVDCTEDATGKPALLKVNRKKKTGQKHFRTSFRIDVCE